MTRLIGVAARVRLALLAGGVSLMLPFGDAIRRKAEMGGNFPHSPDIGVLRAFGQAGKAHVSDHASSQFGHGGILHIET